MTLRDPKVTADMLREAGYGEAQVARMLRALVPGTLIDDHAAHIVGARDSLRVDYYATVESYGNFRGGDPRDFTPDPECSTEEERERHRLACAAAERGEAGALEVRAGSGVEDVDGSPAFVQRSDSFGLGTTFYVDVDRECLIHAVEQMVELLDPAFKAVALPPVEIDVEEVRRLMLSPVETPPRTSPPAETESAK